MPRPQHNKADLDGFIESNFGLVHSVCHKFAGEYDDLFQIGCIGLVKAARTYDAGRGNSFSSYAIPIIRNELLMSFRKKRPDTFSLDEPIEVGKSGETITLLDTLRSNDFVESIVINATETKYKLELLRSLMSPKYTAVFNEYMDGKRQIEISDATGLSRSHVNRILMRIRATGTLIDKDYNAGSKSRIKNLGRRPKLNVAQGG